MPICKKSLLLSAVLLILLSFSFTFCAKASLTMWSQTYGEPTSSGARALVQSLDGGYALAGSSGTDFWLIKTGPNGNPQWNQTYTGTDYETAYALVQTSDGGYAIAGSTGDPKGYHSDFWLVKTDPSGNMEWNHAYGGPERESAEAVIQTSDGGYAIAGYTDSFGAGLKDFWLCENRREREHGVEPNIWRSRL